MNIRKVCIAIAVTAAGIALTPQAEAGRHSGGGHGHASGHSSGSFSRGGGHSFSRSSSFQRGGASAFRGARIANTRNNRAFRTSATNRTHSGVRGAQVRSNRSIGVRTVAVGNNSRYRSGSGSHNTWGGRHHGADHHSRHHHQGFGHGYGLAGFGLLGSAYGYGYGYGGYGYGAGYYNGSYGNRYNSGLNAADIQQALAEQGYYRGEIDGVVGHGTLHAIRAFQADNGLPVSGRIDTQLVQALQL